MRRIFAARAEWGGGVPSEGFTMRRNAVIPLACLLLLVGCGRGERFSALTLDRPIEPPQDQAFSYFHSLALLMDRETVEPRYNAARERCLRDRSLHCQLMSASSSVGDYDDPNRISAELRSALPHDRVGVYEAGLTRRLPGETRDVVIQSHSTRAENVTDEAVDLDKKIAQLTAYRDSLAAMAKRPNLSVSDLIKIESELSKTQADLDQATPQGRDVAARVASEQQRRALAQS